MSTSPAARPPMIGICGSSRAEERTDALAERVGGLVASHGGIVVCGGLGGVMAAAARGVARAGGLSVGLLPGSSPDGADDHLSLVIPTGMGEMRNALLVRSVRAIIAIGGGYGTLSEVALALRAGVPVIGLDTWEIRAPGATGADAGILCATSPYEAVDMAFAAVHGSITAAAAAAVSAEG